MPVARTTRSAREEADALRRQPAFHQRRRGGIEHPREHLAGDLDDADPAAALPERVQDDEADESRADDADFGTGALWAGEVLQRGVSVVERPESDHAV
jgi:hypothetical protein